MNSLSLPVCLSLSAMRAEAATFQNGDVWTTTVESDDPVTGEVLCAPLSTTLLCTRDYTLPVPAGYQNAAIYLHGFWVDLGPTTPANPIKGASVVVSLPNPHSASNTTLTWRSDVRLQSDAMAAAAAGSPSVDFEIWYIAYAQIVLWNPTSLGTPIDALTVTSQQVSCSGTTGPAGCSGSLFVPDSSVQPTGFQELTTAARGFTFSMSSDVLIEQLAFDARPTTTITVPFPGFRQLQPTCNVVGQTPGGASTNFDCTLDLVTLSHRPSRLGPVTPVFQGQGTSTPFGSAPRTLSSGAVGFLNGLNLFQHRFTSGPYEFSSYDAGCIAPTLVSPDAELVTFSRFSDGSGTNSDDDLLGCMWRELLP